MAPPSELLFLTAHELQDKLAAGVTTSVELTGYCLDQIQRHNHEGLKLRAVLSTMPRDKAAAMAEALDRERQDGKLRSSLHGLPIIIKDAIVTGPELGMLTTAGAVVFSTMKAKRNATLVDQLLAAGLIPIAKTNMTEFCGHKSNNTDIGWSAYGGQTLSAYRRDDLEEKDQPFSSGSSSGTAVGMTAGFAPLGIGTETSGSLVYPASANALFGLKIPGGTVPVDGTFKLSTTFDGVGPMARDPRDLAALARILLTKEAAEQLPEGGYEAEMRKGLQGMKIGVTRPGWGGYAQIVKDKWDLPSVISVYESTLETLKANGCRVVYPLECPEASTLKHEDIDLVKLAYNEFPALAEEFISNFEPNPEVTNLKDIIAWNEKHAEVAMPEPRTTQTELIKSLENTITPELHDAVYAELRRMAGPDGMGKVMRENGDLDVVLGASESTLVVYAADAGWPVGAVTMGNLEKNGQPYGFFALAKTESTLLRFMEGWHGCVKGAEFPNVSA